MSKYIFATGASRHLAAALAKQRGLKLGLLEWGRFADEEIFVRLKQAVAGERVIALGSTAAPADNLLELLFLIHTLRENGARAITALIPYFGYAKSDHPWLKGTAATAKLISRLLEEAGATAIISVNLHGNKIVSFFTVPVKSPDALPLIAQAVRRENIPAPVVVSPDQGGTALAKKFARLIKAPGVAVVTKKRLATPDTVKAAALSGSAVNGKNVVIIDDMIQSGGTIAAAAALLNKAGVKKIYAAAIHAVPWAGGLKKLSANKFIKKIIITDTVSPPLKRPAKVKVVPIARWLGGNLIRD